MPADKVTIKIPRPLYEKIKAIIETSGFDSPTDFIVYVLRDLVGGAKHPAAELSEEEVEAIRKRLRSLGYM
ncbi:MAG: CopG family transcriptional regulator [Candidatus Sumerlaeota bacterium]|nr:CopG family transcriptional regulator [Candidatus Sumerlaeota bacterium]